MNTLISLTYKPSSSIARKYSPLISLAALLIPVFIRNEYQLHLLTLIGVYWILISGLNLVVGYSGQLSIGHVGLLAVGAYTLSIGASHFGLNPVVGLCLGAALGGLCGFLLGMPSLRLPGFYFAMATLAFGLIVNELLIADAGLTGGGAGISAPSFAVPFDTSSGFYYLVAVVALIVTWMCWNLSRHGFGRALIALRDSEVAAVSAGIPIFRLKLAIFTFSGVTAGAAGALYASMQNFISPEAFSIDLGMFFFICIIIGGRGSMLGPFVGTIVLTLLPEAASPLAKLGGLLYGLLLLAAVLTIPRGLGSAIGRFKERKNGRRSAPPITPDIDRLAKSIHSSRGQA
jgi:branched-chain amino acid transport system permease protein